MQLLPSDMNKRTTYDAYVDYLRVHDIPNDVMYAGVPISRDLVDMRRPMSLRSFKRFWKLYWSDKIGFILPRSDLCDVCDNYMRRIQALRRSGANTQTSFELMGEWAVHRNLASCERDYYKEKLSMFMYMQYNLYIRTFS